MLHNTVRTNEKCVRPASHGMCSSVYKKNVVFFFRTSYTSVGGAEVAAPVVPCAQKEKKEKSEGMG